MGTHTSLKIKNQCFRYFPGIRISIEYSISPIMFEIPVFIIDSVVYICIINSLDSVLVLIHDILSHEGGSKTLDRINTTFSRKTVLEFQGKGDDGNVENSEIFRNNSEIPEIRLIFGHRLVSMHRT